MDTEGQEVDDTAKVAKSETKEEASAAARASPVPKQIVENSSSSAPAASSSASKYGKEFFEQAILRCVLNCGCISV